MKSLAVIVGALLICGLTGYAVAGTRTSATQTTIKACAKKKGGAMRLSNRKCRRNERRVTWAIKGNQGTAGQAGTQGQAGGNGAAGANGTNGADGTNGTDGTDGNSTGETFFDSDGFGSHFGGGTTCDTTPSGPSITFDAPSGSYAQLMASATSQRAGANSNTACVRIDGTNFQFSSSVSLAAETRYLQNGSLVGTTDPFDAIPMTFPLSAGSHTISMRYGSSGGTSNFNNRNLYVTLFHPAN